MQLSYPQVKSLIDNDKAHVLHVRFSTVQIVLTALNVIAYRGAWSSDDINPLLDAQWDEIEMWIDGAIFDMMQSDQIGQLYWTIRETLPIFCLELDGTTYDKADFPSLYDVLPAAWKSPTQFTLPDWRERFPVLAGSSYAVYQTGGENTHQLTEAEMPSHAHIYTRPIPNVDIEAPGVPDVVAAGVGPDTYTGSTGGNAAHENRPPFVALKVGVIAW